MDEELTFEGKKYISSKRAAALVGYTKDYVGQLCRAGKVEARLVGRSWYVSEESMRKHKLGVHYTLHQPIKNRAAAHNETKAAKEERKATSEPESAVTQGETKSVLEDDQAEPVAFNIVRGSEVSRHEAGARVRNTEPEPVPTTQADPEPGNEPEEKDESPIQPVQRVAEHEPLKRLKPSQERLQADTDIRYEAGGPLYYDDERPLNPTPMRVARFEGTPIPAPVRKVAPATTSQPFAPEFAPRRTQHAGGTHVDGVRQLPYGTVKKDIRRFGPGGRESLNVSAAPKPQRGPTERKSVPQGTEEDIASPAHSSKALPVIAGSIVLFAILASYVMLTYL